MYADALPASSSSSSSSSSTPSAALGWAGADPRAREIRRLSATLSDEAAEHTQKRRRTNDGAGDVGPVPPDIGGAGAELEPPAAGEHDGLLSLPDAILAASLEMLGLSGAWRARRVCRRLRSVVEGVEWRAVELRTRRPADVVALAAICRSGLRLPTDGSLRVCLDLRRELDEGGPRPLAALEAELTVACEGLLFACGRSRAGGVRQARLRRAQLPARDLDRFVGGALDALAPSGPSLCSLALESSCRPASAALCGSADGLGLDSRLAPYASLTSLALPRGCAVGPAAAAAIADRCPSLRSAALCLASAPALAALAPLASLAELELLPGAGEAALAGILHPGLQRLAEGAAGRSLRSLRLSSEGRSCAEAPASAVRALTQMRRLESIDLDLVLRVPAEEDGSSALAALGALPALQRLSLRLRLRGRDGAHLAGLARAARSLASLDLALEAAPDLCWADVDDGALPELARAARKALRRLETQYFPALMPEEAAALAEVGPQLESVHLSHHLLDPDDTEPYGALRELAGRLPRGAFCVEPVLQRQLPGRPGEASRVSAHARRRLPRLLPAAKVSFTYAAA